MCRHRRRRWPLPLAMPSCHVRAMRRRLCVRSIERSGERIGIIFVFFFSPSKPYLRRAGSMGLRHDARLQQYCSMRGHAVSYLRACVGGYRRHRHCCSAAPTTTAGGVLYCIKVIDGGQAPAWTGTTQHHHAPARAARPTILRQACAHVNV